MLECKKYVASFALQKMPYLNRILSQRFKQKDLKVEQMPLMAEEMSKETSAKLMKEGEHHSYNKSGLEFQYQKNFFY